MLWRGLTLLETGGNCQGRILRVKKERGIDLFTPFGRCGRCLYIILHVTFTFHVADSMRRRNIKRYPATSSSAHPPSPFAARPSIALVPER